MDVDEVAEDQLIQDSARSLSATPLTARFGQRSYESHCPSSSTKQTCEIPDFLGVPDAIEASTLVQESGGDRIAWHDLEMQLMQATLEDKKMSELILERAIQRHNQARCYSKRTPTPTDEGLLNSPCHPCHHPMCPAHVRPKTC